MLKSIKDDLSQSTGSLLYALYMWLWLRRANRAQCCGNKKGTPTVRQVETGKSALAEHAVSLNHEILLSSAEILLQPDGYWEHMICETLEIKLNAKSVNRDNSLTGVGWRSD